MSITSTCACSRTSRTSAPKSDSNCLVVVRVGGGAPISYALAMLTYRRFLIGFLTATLLTGTAFALDGEKYLPDASVTLAQARETGLKTYPGKIVSEELEEA